MGKRPRVRGARKKSKSPKMNPSNMMAQVQKMQDDMAQTREKLADEVFTVTAGGGAISIDITGHQRLQSITIDPDLVDPEEIEMLQDMIVAAVNAAIEQSQIKAAEKMEGITGDLGAGPNLSDLLGSLGDF